MPTVTDSPAPLTIITPAGKSLAQSLAGLFHRRRLIPHMVGINLRKTYSRTWLGSLWWLMEPLCSMLIYTLIVTVIFNRGHHHKPFPIFVFCALLPWKCFTGALTRSLSSISESESLGRFVALPQMLFPTVQVVISFYQFGIGLGLTLVLASVWQVYPHWTLLALPAVVLMQFTLTLALSVFLAAIGTMFRDLQHMMRFILQLGFYASPSLYGIEDVPPRLAKFYAVNPFTTVFGGYRDCIMNHRWPDFSTLGLWFCASFLLLILALMFFQRRSKSFYKY